MDRWDEGFLWPDSREKPPFGSVEIDWKHDLTRGLVGAWLFNESGGTTVYDLAGHYNGIVNSASWTSGAGGPAVSFDGTSSFIDFSAIPVQSAPVTFAFWATPTNANLLGLYDSAPAAVATLRCYAQGGGGNPEWHNEDPFTLANVTAGALVHVVMVYTYDGNRHLSYYKNGVLQATVNGSTTATLGWTTLRVGDINSGGAGRYTGLVSGFNLYSRVLTAQDVNWLYAEPYAFVQSKIRRKWSLPTATAAAATARANRRTLMGVGV